MGAGVGRREGDTNHLRLLKRHATHPCHLPFCRHATRAATIVYSSIEIANEEGMVSGDSEVECLSRLQA
jgi:hypothetical protein